MDPTGTKWRKYRVVRKEAESRCITSFYFQPIDGASLEPFKPGQFLTFRLRDRGSADVVRNYSLSNTPDEPGHYRISVKRELSPLGDLSLPPGIASNYLHDQINIGDEIEIFGPSGGFYLNEESTRPVLLLSGGVGLTPLVSMAHRLARAATRRTWFVHACESGDVHALRREIEMLAAGAENLRTYFCYNKPTDIDRQTSAFDGEGFITAEKLQTLLPLDDYECYLCGPSTFMQALYDILTKLGIREERIHYEFFGPATVLKPTRSDSAVPKPAVAEITSTTTVAERVSPLVIFAKSGLCVPWDDKFESILELAETHGLTPDFSCRSGVCSSCQCKLISGTVVYAEELLSEVESGAVLICCSKPAGDVSLDI
jgi:ferredoxin-NADP reductase/ferredoxin